MTNGPNLINKQNSSESMTNNKITNNEKETNIPIVELEDVYFSYNTDPVLRGISFQIQKGDYAGIIGPNGGGKTTLLKIILGLLTPSSGIVKLFGVEISEFKEWSRIGYLPQRAAHYDIRFPITVYEAVSQGRISKVGIFRRFTSLDYEAIDKALSISGVDHLKNRLLGDLSGGERQRVFIARALASEPDILILDEPAAGIDIASQSKFYSFLKDLNKTHEITIIFVSHDIDILAHEATNLICVNHELVCFGDPSLMFKNKRQILESLYGKNAKFILDQK